MQTSSVHSEQKVPEPGPERDAESWPAHCCCGFLHPTAAPGRQRGVGACEVASPCEQRCCCRCNGDSRRNSRLPHLHLAPPLRAVTSFQRGRSSESPRIGEWLPVMTRQLRHDLERLRFDDELVMVRRKSPRDHARESKLVEVRSESRSRRSLRARSSAPPWLRRLRSSRFPLKGRLRVEPRSSA